MVDCIIFLDFDGPVISHRSWVLGHNLVTEKMDPVSVATIKLAADMSGAKIVISSSWRLYGKELVLKILADNGIPSSYIHYHWKIDSPIYIEKRGDGIKDWLASHPEVKRYVALDDAPLGIEYQIQMTSENGLTYENQWMMFNLLGCRMEANRRFKELEQEKFRKRNTVYHRMGK